jgi:hypothetical protein
VILYQEVDVVGGEDVAQNDQSEGLLGLEQPVQPSLAVVCELQQLLPLMAAVCDAPNLPGDVMPCDADSLSP